MRPKSQHIKNAIIVTTAAPVKALVKAEVRNEAAQSTSFPGYAGVSEMDHVVYTCVDTPL
jgi:hypothetical protein